VFASWLAPLDASLAFAIAFVLLWLGLMAILYRYRIFIKV
jgi:predicted acyltransferase